MVGIHTHKKQTNKQKTHTELLSFFPFVVAVVV